MKKSTRYRKLTTHLPAIGSLLAFSVYMATNAIASPADDFTRAVTRSGAENVEAAKPDQFLQACAAIFIALPEKDVVWYVNAAVKLRPDLAERTVVAVLNARIVTKGRTDKQKLGRQISDIIQAAIMAKPDAAAAIVTAAIKAHPFARAWIVTAAIAAAPDQMIAILAAAAEADDVYGATKTWPWNRSAEPLALMDPRTFRNANVNSPEQPPF